MEVGLQTDQGYPHQGHARLRGADRRSVDRHAGGARHLPESGPGPAAGLFRARARPVRAARQRACSCPTRRSAATRAAAICWSSTRTMWSSSARWRSGQLEGDMRVIEKGINADDRVLVAGIMRAVPGQKVDPRTQDRGRDAAGAAGEVTAAMISKFFIERPVLANVLAILMVVIGAVALYQAAGRAISRHRAADRAGDDALSGRQRAHRDRHRRAADRAAGQRRGRHDLHAVLRRRGRHLHADRHVRHRHRAQLRAGAGAEPRVVRARRSCRRPCRSRASRCRRSRPRSCRSSR